ncbi:MAG: hemolysin family protein [Alphaproteobacteria bacterium]|uniref:CNNM domain-containing protein n=1 Tax=Pseudorhizobium pelagicum TaxID=1509405 RepID=UPI001DFFC7C7|nr:hemolysin family protein [Alphaproteobacteria bacterium]MBU1552451.1 hemolysin family protein [Alphaproteobacteria bacterium]MBU2339518.1 hemolysin family protein [Alphaproteobacteria bacterium]MBU2390230.1 hemolysin family protein [Alphaproteobacteria bacterium]MDY6962831.1 hemolysin family protein [Pseudomonadota bacterium]|tara:strand:- start:459 stop:1502 length:1044 start_codon:yes stop_codon:yes gene_type:complete
MTLLIIYVALAVGISFLCSILEAVLLSITPSYTATLEETRPETARKIKVLKDDIDRPLAAILSLNTVAHTAGAAGAGAQAALVFGDTSIAIFSAVLTLLILVLSEIIPKTLGAMYWREFTPMVARILPPMIWSMWPLVKMSQFITLLLSRGKRQPPVSREEIAAMADIGHREGVIDKGDSKVFRNLLKFDRLTVGDIMTPRTVVFALDQETTIDEAIARKAELSFSRIPIFAGSIDKVTGFVLKTDILYQAVDGNGETTLQNIRRDLDTVIETMPLEELFDALVHKDRHVALVVDEFGGTAGVVTLEDLIETLIGEEIVDEADSITDLQAYARKRWSERHGKASAAG